MESIWERNVALSVAPVENDKVSYLSKLRLCKGKFHQFQKSFQNAQGMVDIGDKK